MITVQAHITYRLAAVVSAIVSKVAVFSFLITNLFLCACSAESDPQQDTNPVAVDFALTVAKMSSAGTTGMTRMTVANTEGSSDNILLRCAIPFAFDPPREIRIGDTYSSTPIVDGFKQSPTGKPFFTAGCTFDAGVCSVLAYGCDKNRSAGHARGALIETLSDYQPANIKFELKSIKERNEYLGINGDTDVKTIAEELAEYLTSIANAKTADDKTWKSNVTDSKLKLMYKNFINEISEGVGDILPGSSANVKAWVTELWTNLYYLPLTEDTDDDKIRDAIIEKIEEKLNTATTPKDWKTAVKTAWDGFPASLGLPDGAAVVRWQTVKKENNSEVEEFVVETQTTTIANINNIERFTFPAEIYYYGNSLVMVSDADLSGNFETKENWDGTDGVLSGFNGGNKVKATTKTVAMKDPLQYGVAQLVVTLKQTASTLPDSDSKGDNISVGNNFKLTGIIVGGQLPVGFDFTPGSAMQGYSEEKMSFIYDNQFNTNGSGNDYFYLSSTADATNVIQTLVLQSYNGQNVKFVLELENKGDKFEGLNGTVYPGTKFYLVGEIVPKSVDDDPEVYDNRVFTQDHITTVSVTVNSLAKAYNVLPNLMSPRLEMGIELTPKWEQATTTDVIL